MSNVKVDYVSPGATASEEAVKEVAALVDVIIKTPEFVGKPAHVVLNALLSAYWTSASMLGVQESAAEGMVQMGGSYLAGRALARQGLGIEHADAKPAVH